MTKPSNKVKTKQATKKIKSFSVDASIYVKLQGLFEKSGSHISLSIFVNEYLKQLLEYLSIAERSIMSVKSDLPLTDVIYNSLKIKYFDAISPESWKELTQLFEVEQFRTLAKSPSMKIQFADTRIKNLIDAHEASKRGMTLDDYKHEEDERIFRPSDDEIKAMAKRKK